VDAPRAIIDFDALEPSPSRCVFAEPVAEFQARALARVEPAVRAAERAAREGAWVVGVVAYEAAPAFDPCLRVRPGCPVPLAWFGAFEAPAVRVRPPRLPCHQPAVAAEPPDGWAASEGRARHGEKVRGIREAIAAGDVYQVNHTFRLRGPARLDPRATYERLLAAAPAPFAAYVRLPGHHVVSLSPELFFARTGRRVTTRPMKGTAPRGRWTERDDALARMLAESEKDRAENLMIVDLLRNDLGRVAEVGTVAVQDLFRVERHPTVHQMTSTVRATLRPDVDLFGVFAALFPCGSVTGAPKIAATAAIAGLEDAPRGVYCGAVGVVRPGGDAIFNVAIRTAVIDAEGGGATYGVGGGVTWNSTPDGEWEEALGKAAVLGPARPAASLMETLRCEHGEPVRWPAHRERMLASARLLGHPANAGDLDAVVSEAAARHADSRRILRVTLDRQGRVSVRVRPLEDADELHAAAAARPVSSADPRLFHKTIDRTLYDAAREGLAPGVEPLLWNERGHATEFARGNLVIERDGRLHTPPVDAGLLPGVLRSELVRAGRVLEREIPLEEVGRATRVWFINSAREWIPVRWNPPSAEGVASNGAAAGAFPGGPSDDTRRGTERPGGL